MRHIKLNDRNNIDLGLTVLFYIYHRSRYGNFLSVKL